MYQRVVWAPDDRHTPFSSPVRPRERSDKAGVAITTVSAPESTLGRVRQTYARKESFPPITQAYTKVSQVVRETGLLERTPWFYITVGIAIALGFGGAITAFILLGDSWFQLIVAACPRHPVHAGRVPLSRGRAPHDPQVRARQ